MTEEKRQLPRVEKIQLTNIEDFTSMGFHSVVGRTLDLSIGGVKVETPHPVPSGAQVRVTLILDADTTAEVEGEVRHVIPRENNLCHVGIQFTQVPQEVQQAITAWLKENPSS